MDKLSKLKLYMNENSIDICIFRQAENVSMFSGYWPRNGYTFYVVGRDSEPMLVTPEVVYKDAKSARVQDVRKFGFIRIKDGNPFENISTILKSYKKENHIIDGAIVGMDIGFDVISVPLCSGEIAVSGDVTLAMIKDSFLTEAIVSCKDRLNKIRAIKNDEDIKKLEIANELGIMACDYFKKIVAVGERDIDIAAKTEAYFAMTASGYKGSQYGKAWVQIGSGSKTASEGWFIGVVSENRIIESGDMVMLEMGAIVDGYWCDLTSVCVAGEANEQQKNIINIVKEAQMEAIKSMKPGAIAKDVYQVAMDYISKKGYGDQYVHGLGHGLGFNYHEAIPALGPSSQDVLLEGMVMSCEPGIYIDGEFGVRLESNILITSTGYKILGV